MARTIGFDDEQALDRAVDLFWSKGYHHTSAQDLVDRLGLNRSSIYNTFGGKREFFLVALKRYRDRESAELISFLGTAPATVASIRTLLTNVQQASTANKTRMGCLMVNTAVELGASERDIQRIVQDNVHEVVAALEVFIQRGHDAGTINDKPAAHGLALVLFHTITALRVTTKVLRDPDFFDEYINAQLQLFKP